MNRVKSSLLRHSVSRGFAANGLGCLGWRRLRFWIEASLATASALLSVTTLVVRDWIEAVFGVDPDRHSGAFEWWVVAVFSATAVISGLLTRVEWRRSLLDATSVVSSRG